MDPGALLRTAAGRLREALGERRIRRGAGAAGVAYLLGYLYAVGHLVITPGLRAFPGRGPFFVVGLENLWRLRAPYNWEPVAVLQPVDGIALFLSLPNLLLGSALGTLLALNLAAFVHVYLRSRQCSPARSASGLLASLPAFVTGFACCAPSFLVVLGAVSATSFLLFVQIVMPVALAALVLALLWNLVRDVPGLASGPRRTKA